VGFGPPANFCRVVPATSAGYLHDGEVVSDQAL